MIELNKADISFLQELKNLEDLNEYEYESNKLFENLFDNGLSDEYAQDLLDFIDDKKLEYGFDDDYSVNNLGQKATLLWDKVFNQI